MPDRLQDVARSVYHPIKRRRSARRYGGVDTVRKTVSDVTIEFDTSTRVSKNWFFPRYAGDRLHEPAVTGRLCDWLEPESVFYDVGTHVGWYATVAAALLDGGAVHAFDLDERALDCVDANLTANGDDTTARVVHGAVSDTDGEEVPYAPFVPDAYSPFGGVDRAINRVTGEPGRAIGTAPTLTLDRYAATAPDPDVLKVDVEGHEAAVLRGGFDVLSRARPRLLLAVHPPQLRDQGEAPAAVYELLESLEYAVETVSRDSPLGDGTECVETLVCEP